MQQNFKKFKKNCIFGLTKKFDNSIIILSQICNEQGKDVILMNFNLLKGKIKENAYTQKDISEQIGISLQSFNSKINGKRKFTLDEVINICKILKIEDPNQIFFNK